MTCSMDRWVGKVAIVTGGSKGIGYAISEQLVIAGVNVVAVARGQEKLDEVSEKLNGKKGKIFTYSADLGKEDDILGLFKWVKENLGPVHILVNNAAIFTPTSLTEGETKVWKAFFDVQVLGVCIATREAVQDMRANKVDGHIIHINSLSGHKVYNYPGVGVTAACKHALTALTETLRNEFNLFKDKIKVSSISPGFVDTEGTHAAYEDIKDPIATAASDEFMTSPKLYPVDLAHAAIYVLSTPPHVQIHELMIKPVGEIM